MVPIRLDAGPCPELRRDFKITNLKQVVTLLRPVLVAAALIIIQTWVSVGQPRSAARLASFEDWAQVMDGILTSTCAPGFLSNLHGLPSGCGPHPLMQFPGRWHEKYGGAPVGVTELFELADELVAPSANKCGRAISFGKQLASWAGQQFGLVSDRVRGYASGGGPVPPDPRVTRAWARARNANELLTAAVSVQWHTHDIRPRRTDG